MAKTLTKGDIIVEDIKVGDIHYEFEFGFCIKSKVLSLPSRDNDGCWMWKSENTNTGKEIQYGVREGMSHYAPNLYSYEAYSGCKYI
jgi:hypothetical protein